MYRGKKLGEKYMKIGKKKVPVGLFLAHQAGGQETFFYLRMAWPQPSHTPYKTQPPSECYIALIYQKP